MKFQRRDNCGRNCSQNLATFSRYISDSEENARESLRHFREYSTTNRSLYRHVVCCVPVSCKANGAGTQLGAWRYSDLLARVYLIKGSGTLFPNIVVIHVLPNLIDH